MGKSNSHCNPIISQGGVDIGDVDSKALKMEVAVGGSVDESSVKAQLLNTLDAGKKDRVAKFVTALYKLYVDLYFTYLEINPLVVTADKIYILDLAAKVRLTQGSNIPGTRGIIISTRWIIWSDSWDGTTLNWPVLPESAWAGERLIELAEQVGKMAEHHLSKSTPTQLSDQMDLRLGMSLASNSPKFGYIRLIWR